MDKKINLIPDVECNLDHEDVDLMGTRPYVDVLEKMIEENVENYTPLTIGLFGRWGSGKSSIIKTLSERLCKKDSNNAVKTVIYDAWKYSGDAFRRSFILELKNQLKLNWEKCLEVFYTDKSEDVSSRIDLVRHWWAIPLSLMPLLATFIWFLNPSQPATNSAVTFLSIIVSVVTFFLSQAFVKYKIAVTTPRIFSPEQFKSVFDQAISDVTGESATGFKRWWKKVFSNEPKCKQIVVVVDNVDRCDRETAKELLLNIKTYLEHKKCIVIMPVDDSAIKSHLRYIGDEEADEFLRKIFNVSIRIKGLNNIDRYDFTRNLIKKYQLGFSNEAASVISQEFAKNPRRIIQFLNSLAIEKEIASEQEKKGCIPKGSVTKNIDFLAKILLLKEEYSFLYDAILFDGINLSKWEDLYKNVDDKCRIKEKNELRMFFGRTSGIVTPKNIRSYFLLHSKDDLVPLELINFIQAGQPEDVMEKIKKETLDFNTLLDHLNEVLDIKLIIRGVSANPELAFLIWCFAQDEFDKTFKERQADFYRYFSYIKSEHIGSLSPLDVMKGARLLKKESQDGLYNSIVSYVNSEADVKTEFLQEFIKIFHLPQDLNNVKERINKSLTENVALFEIILPYLKETDVSGSYINPETINKHVAALSVKRTDNDVKICNAVKACLSVSMLQESAHNTFLQNVLKSLNNEQTPVCYKFWFQNLKGCMKVDSGASQLVQWLKQIFKSPVFPNCTNAQWKDVLTSMMPLFEECFIKGDTSVWASIAKVYVLSDELSLIANSSLKEIVEKTEPGKWNFLDDVIRKTTSMSITDDYFVVLGDILEKGIRQSIVKDKPQLLENWLHYIIAKENITENEQKILSSYCMNDIFHDLCKNKLEVAKKLFAKGKVISIKEIIDATADIILSDASPEDVRYLIDQEYDPTDKIKTTIQSKISTGDNEIEWIKIVTDSEKIWTAREYKKILEDRLLHLATGTETQKKQAKELWGKVTRDKISTNKRSIIEKGIAEIEEANIVANGEESAS